MANTRLGSRPITLFDDHGRALCTTHAVRHSHISKLFLLHDPRHKFRANLVSINPG
jgi:hypothetical protein